ncbi:putative adenylyl cyclase CyaB [Nocardia sp. GAS34]|uniref:class IV adenylate cyclase n=1 Tax=unclassified Nocardia TaxID=2637762 RepID=UPI003D22679A
MQHIVRPGGLFGAEFMMPVAERHHRIERYTTPDRLAEHFDSNAWDVLLTLHTDPFTEHAYVEQLHDHTHRMGVLIAAKHQHLDDTKGTRPSMKHEYEAKFLAIDIDAIRTTLTALGAKQIFPRTLLTRKIFENDTLARGAWLRLRNEGSRSTLTLKQVTDATTIDGTTEIETTVGDLAAMAEILTHLGAREVRYQENYREEWQLGQITYDIDTWPDLPTFLEIEGPNETAVHAAATSLGLDYAHARFGSVDEIYKTENGRNILTEPTLLFNAAAETNDTQPPV